MTTARRFGRLAAWAALCAGLGLMSVSCSTNPPAGPDGLEIIISTDGLRTGTDFDDIKLNITEQADGGWSSLWNRDYMVPSTEAPSLPTTFTLFAGPSPEEVVIEVTAYKGGAYGQPIVQRVAEVQVPTDRMAVLYLVLASVCEGYVVSTGAEGEPTSTCGVGQSCLPSKGACGSNVVDPTTLQTYMPGQSLDAGVLGVLGGGGTDAGDAGNSAPPREAGVSDTGAEAGPIDASAMEAAEAAETEAAVTTGAPDATGDGGVCTNACTEGLTQCAPDGGAVQTCTQSSGCTQWTTSTCGTHQTCTGTGSAAACTCDSSVCTSTSAACADSTTVANCAKDAYGCYYEASSSACSIGCHGGVCDVCPGSAQQCSGSTPQTCTSGQWVSGTACSGSTPYCNGAGVCGACQNGATQCSFNGVQTCTSGAWGSTVACPATTPNCSAGVCGQPTSCQTSGSGLTNCGSASESCCSSPEVTPNGSYYRTYTYGSTSSYADAATVSGFRLDKYLVTVGRFRKFVAAWSGGYYPSSGSGIHTHLNGGSGLNATGGGYETGWDATDWNNTTDIDPANSNLACGSPYNTWTNTAGSQENLPINCVTWYEAYAFCIWDGGFLPSEAEWEYAAAGGSQQLEYPWGSTAPGTACPGTGCQYAIYGCYYPSGSGSCTGVANIAPVGTATLGVGYWGQLDMAGEMWEWNLDWYATYVDPCINCTDLSAASDRVLRGGSFSFTASVLLPPFRNDLYPPTFRGGFIGFRCARTP